MGEEVNKDSDENECSFEYEAFMNHATVEEQPFYYEGISFEDYQKELSYLNKHIESFYDGSYVPLWKKRWFY
mgnify:FL=1